LAGVTLDGVTKIYEDGTAAVSDLALEIADGEFMVLVGPSGCAFGLPFAIFLLRNFFAGIPRELLEAARMDGASELKVFRSVILPIGLPAIASLAIFQFLWVWNDLLVGLVFAGTDNAPLTVAIRSQMRQFGTNIDVIAPAAFLSMIVPLLVFFAFQRYFVQGLLAGSER
jgi:alpha-glucoside transport system permease protein